MNKNTSVGLDDHGALSYRDRPATGYNLLAVALSVADLVDMAGGLLCDRAMCGWTVTAVVLDCADDTPLKILGASVYRSTADLPPVEEIAPQTLIVSAGSLNSGRCALTDVRGTYDFNEIEVLWYGNKYKNQRSARDRVNYRISSASRAFKTQAQAAAGLPAPSTQDIETFVRLTAATRFGVKTAHR